MHVVLIEPQIPPNTGNISRQCAGTNTDLHLVGELGFSLDEKRLRRAGLDYWEHVKLHLHDSFEALVEAHAPKHIAFYSARATQPYTDFAVGPEIASDDIWFVFGKETAGLPKALMASERDNLYTIPISDKIRSLNLANSVAIVLYDALRQRGFEGLND